MVTDTPSLIMDPSSTMDSTITADLFEQMYQQHLNPGLMTPLDDWSNPDLLTDLINTTSALPIDGRTGDILVIPPQQQQHHSLVQDTFLTSPCSTKDYFWPCPPAQDLFNALSTPSISPVMAIPDTAITTGDGHFGGLIDSLVVPGSPALDSVPLSDARGAMDCPLTDGSCSNTPPPPPPHRQQHQPISPPLEMIMKLDSPISSCAKTTVAKKDAPSLKRKVTAPATAQSVACHITSASTPTFVLKQPNRKRTSRSTDNNTTTSGASSKNAEVSSELAMKRQKNTDAARRSRLKKLQKMETMAARVSEMEMMHQRLLSRVSALESDKSLLLKKESDYVSRIQQLETDLTLAQQKLAYTS